MSTIHFEPEELFAAYIAIFRHDPNDRRLRPIEKELRRHGYHIEIPEKDRVEVGETVAGEKILSFNMYLVKNRIVTHEALGVVLIPRSTPKPGTLILDHPDDRKFLKDNKILYDP